MNQRVDVGNVLSRAFGIYGEQASTLLPVAFVLFLIVGIVQGVIAPVGALLSFIVGIYFTGMVVRLVEDVQDGRRDYSVATLFGSVTPVALPLLGASIVVAIIEGVGFVLVILPGLVAITLLAVVAPVVVIENGGVFGSIGRSYRLVKSHFWPVFGVVLVALLINIVIGGIALLIGASIGGTVGSIVLSVLASTVTAPISALVAAVLYFTLVGVEGGAPGVAAPGPEAPGTTPPPPPAAPPPPPAAP